jgi:hypothetical protein
MVPTASTGHRTAFDGSPSSTPGSRGNVPFAWRLNEKMPLSARTTGTVTCSATTSDSPSAASRTLRTGASPRTAGTSATSRGPLLRPAGSPGGVAWMALAPRVITWPLRTGSDFPRIRSSPVDETRMSLPLEGAARHLPRPAGNARSELDEGGDEAPPSRALPPVDVHRMSLTLESPAPGKRQWTCPGQSPSGGRVTRRDRPEAAFLEGAALSAPFPACRQPPVRAR